jgi:hydrogenase maturation protein HypF
VDEETRRIIIEGNVQGVGFRPHVFRLAQAARLPGHVRNTPEGVEIIAQGTGNALDCLLDRIIREAPPAAAIRRVSSEILDSAVSPGSPFAILPSIGGPHPRSSAPPDLAPCPACRRELFDPHNRRHRYPFLNCTQCGPRYSILLGLPYDRPQTTMRGFVMCPACAAEYTDPANRRFHAEPNACPACGPRLALAHPGTGEESCDSDGAISRAAKLLSEGGILALKGIGGFQLLCRADDDSAVRRLRERKQRPQKPFALMVADMDAAARLAMISPAGLALMEGPAAPIVLLRKRENTQLAPSVAPDNARLGIMLPASPLHILLADACPFPLVCTSGNLSEEPLCVENQEALERLGPIADLFLWHNRPVARAVDDSVMMTSGETPVLLRMGRGTAPGVLPWPGERTPIITFGGHMKNTVSVAGRGLVCSQHIGDLDSPLSREAADRTRRLLSELLRAEPALAVCDLHPDYHSTAAARASGLPIVQVQHHVAHARAALANSDNNSPALAVIWDGTGWGEDETIWGGELFRMCPGHHARIGHLRPFPLPGGEAAVREPRRCAFGLLHALGGRALACDPQTLERLSIRTDEAHIFAAQIEQAGNAPQTTSIGRLFDAISALSGGPLRASFEGQAAIALEALALEAAPEDISIPWIPSTRQPSWQADIVADPTATEFLRALPCPADILPGNLIVLDWQPILEWIITKNPSPAVISATFHHALADAIGNAASMAGCHDVALGGGCFQNATLLDLTLSRLRRGGFHIHFPSDIPPNDGGISTGQALAALPYLKHFTPTP